jgi:DNA-binding NarL/FixJ family response regulator
VFRSERPHGVLVDLTLGSSSGLDLIVDLLNVDRQVPVLVVSMHDELLYAERALRAGARGYVMKHQATEHVADAVQRILSGETAFSPAVRQRLLSKVVDNRPGRAAGLGVHALSTREMEVLHLIGLGYSSAEIASALSRSVKTVESHRASIRAKLDLSTNFELIRYATRFAEPGGARTIVEDA